MNGSAAKSPPEPGRSCRHPGPTIVTSGRRSTVSQRVQMSLSRPPGDRPSAVRPAHRGPRTGVNVDAGSASADPARARRRSTARRCQVPGTPRNSTLPDPRSPARPTTKSRTVRNSGVAGAGLAEDPRTMCTTSPPMSNSSSAHSPGDCRRGSRCRVFRRQRATPRHSGWPASGRRTGEVAVAVLLTTVPPIVDIRR